MPYDLFISYAHQDNDHGQVKELCDAIFADFRQFGGRDLLVFFDERDIPSMADWEARIALGLRESRLFLAVISPSYFASTYCRREWEEYVRYEAMRQCLGEGVAPIYFVELPGLQDSAVEAGIAGWVADIRSRQWCDLASQDPVKIVRWHEAGRRALEDEHVAERLQTLKKEIRERLARADLARQSPTNLYRHNPQFVGRVRELTILREALNERGSVGIVGHGAQSATVSGATALYGLGGMGKTELALAYAHAFAWDYPGGRWLLSCEGLHNFDVVLRQLAVSTALNISFTEEEQKDPSRAAERVLAELRRRERSLLLLDNVTHPGLLGPDVLMRLPAQGQVHVLATTRLGPQQLAGSPHDHTFVAVDQLPVADALALIRAHQPEARFASPSDEAAATELVALLDGFTLAVETAAIYLGRHAAEGAIEAYTNRLRSVPLTASEDFAADSVVGVRHKEKLLERTLAITFEGLTDEQLHVLMLGALLPPDQIALPWLHAMAKERFPHLLGDGPEQWRHLEDTLRGLRLFTPGQEERVGRMHRMVQLLITRRIFAGVNGNEIEDTNQALTTHVLERGEYLAYAWEQHSNRWELQPLQSTAVLWLDENRHEGYELACSLVVPLNELALFSEAERLARKAFQFAETKYGAASNEVSRSANVLGAVLKETNRFADAEVELRRAMAIDERLYKQDAPEIAIALSNLGSLLHTSGRFAEAESLLERAVNILEGRKNPNRLALVSALMNLAEIREDAHRLKDAETLYQRALSLAEETLEPQHYSLGVLLSNFSSLMHKMNRLEEAEKLLRRALAIAERTFGRKHPSFALRLNNLAELLREADRFAEAEPLYEEALAIDEELFGANHSDVARVLNNLGLIYRETGRAQQSEQLYRRSLAIWEGIYGPLHPDVAAVLGNLAKVVGKLGRREEAEKLFRRALEIEETLFGNDHPHLAPTLSNLAWLLCEQKRFDEAESISRRQLLLVSKVSEREQSDHVYLRIAAANYLDLLKRIGLSESTARTRVDQVLRGTGFSLFGPSVSR